MTAITKAERRFAHEQALANTRIEGHVPVPEFIADLDAVVEGRTTYDEVIAASLARAIGRDAATAIQPAQVAPVRAKAAVGRER